MVYSGGFVICIIVNGQVQEERADGIVILPEGTEYAIRLRNKNTRRAVGKIFIDGENVSDGGYVVNANSFIDIRRFAHKDEAFRLAGLNSPEAVDAGKNGPNDGTKGVIEVRFKLEQQPDIKPLIYQQTNSNKRSWPKPKDYPYWSSEDKNRGLEREEKTSGGITLPDIGGASYNCSLERGFSPSASTKLEDGVTVGGATTGQQFSYTHLNLESVETVLKIILKIGEPQVRSYYCTKCGAKLSKTDNFCAKCGKQLILAR